MYVHIVAPITGGGDRYEGGANSIYSGWTNAPIAWAFLINSGVGSLFAGRPSLECMR